MAMQQGPRGHDAEVSWFGASYGRILAKVALTLLGATLVVSGLGWLASVLLDWNLQDVANVSQGLLAVFAFMAFGTAVWAGLETREIRRQAESEVALLSDQVEAGRQQLEILQDQERLRVAPYLFASVMNPAGYKLLSNEPEDKIPVNVKYFVQVVNLSPNLALSVVPFMYDQLNKHFLGVGTAREFVNERQPAWFNLVDIMTEAELADRLRATYRLDTSESAEMFRYSPRHNFLVVVFFGLDGQPYAHLRELSIAGEDGVYRGLRSERRFLKVLGDVPEKQS